MDYIDPEAIFVYIHKTLRDNVHQESRASLYMNGKLYWWNDEVVLPTNHCTVLINKSEPQESEEP